MTTSATEPRPLAMLDIDGVLVLENPVVPVETHTVSAYRRWAREVRIPVGAAESVRELARRFDIVWTTAWSHNAHIALAPALGLPEEPWPFLAVQFNKLPAIRAYAGGRPWVWIDDSIHDLGEIPAPADGLLVPVDGSRGITEIDPAELLEKLSRL
ncbi:hypothetical protein SAMN05421630_102155 [Prauserella marina]|uniref:Uncharacterized protein n=1 Tax=Prauserella marina TaxID=530584 RepID=A0A1G6LQQ6_9PSEU|nr:HAD domain-containing protein [Prauserella marina]PWV85807.1 hypothetical protein DES30_1011837 [Prauserella marina]SDC45026.1 hypothetical protein SAMN05421630_102155 [Prauserella marina]